MAGQSHDVSGYALPDDAGCFPLPVLCEGAGLRGILSVEPALPKILEALGGVRRVLPDGAVIYTGTNTNTGRWNEARWHAEWGEIAPLALADMLDNADQPVTVLRHRIPMILARTASRIAARVPQPAEIRSDTGHESVEVVSETISHRGFFQTRTYRLRHPRFDGRMSAEVEREVFVASDAAIVLPYDPQRDRVLLIEQFRLGPFGRGDARPWMLEPVAGRIDAGESAESAARRECQEEAGLTLESLEFITSYYCSPGCLTEYHHCYLGLAQLPEITQGHAGLSTEHEDIRTHVLPFEQAMKIVATGEADNAPLILMLFWLQANRDRLRHTA